MYTFTIAKDHIPLLKMEIMDDETFEKDPYLKGLIEKCFRRVFETIGEEERDSSEEANLEDED